MDILRVDILRDGLEKLGIFSNGDDNASSSQSFNLLICNKIFFSNGEVTPFGATKPKGAIVINIEKVEEFK